MIAIDLPNARRMAFGVVLGQAAVTLIAALVCLALAGRGAALSALLGGGISTAASLVMAALSFGGSAAGASAQRAIRAFYIGEAVKLVLVVVLFAVVLKALKVSPLPLFAAYLATFFVYWIALANALPGLGGGAGRREP